MEDWIEDLPEPLRGMATNYSHTGRDHGLIFGAGAEDGRDEVTTTTGEMLDALRELATANARLASAVSVLGQVEAERDEARKELARWTGSFEDHVLVPREAYQEMVGALREFAAAADNVEVHFSTDDAEFWDGDDAGLDLGSLRRARAALAKLQD